MGHRMRYSNPPCDRERVPEAIEQFPVANRGPCGCRPVVLSLVDMEGTYLDTAGREDGASGFQEPAEANLTKMRVEHRSMRSTPSKIH
jgi:hypothetical protein